MKLSKQDVINAVHDKIHALIVRQLDGRIVIITKDGFPQFAGQVWGLTMKQEGYRCRFIVSVRDITDAPGLTRVRARSFEYPEMKWNRRMKCWEVQI